MRSPDAGSLNLAVVRPTFDLSHEAAINELRRGQSNTVRADRRVICIQTLSDLRTCECLLQFGTVCILVYGQLCMCIQRSSLDIQI